MATCVPTADPATRPGANEAELKTEEAGSPPISA